MMISNRTAGMLAAGLFLSAAAPGDEIALHGDRDERLSGRVVSIDGQGVIELESPLAKAPLRLNPGAVREVRFAEPSTAGEVPGMLIELANGDLLPAEVLGLTDGKLEVDSPLVGKLAIAREALDSLQLGVKERRVLFRGPGGTAGWNWPELRQKPADLDNVPSIAMEEDGWVVTGKSYATRMVDLPSDFIIRFTLEWEPGQQPNSTVSFADDLLERGERADRYYLQYGAAGFEIKRESKEGQRWQTVLIANRLPAEFPERKLRVEVHVSRSTKRVHLFLNGEAEGWGEDPATAPPGGSGVSIRFESVGDGKKQAIRSFEVLELDNARMRHREEDRGDPAKDSLITRKDDRCTGQLRAVVASEGKLRFEFQSVLRDEPLVVPSDDVSTVFFARSKERGAEEATPYVLRLRGDGVLSVRSCRFEQGKVTVDHPLLGPLVVVRDSIVSLENREVPEEDKNKDKESEKEDHP